MDLNKAKEIIRARAQDVLADANVLYGAARDRNDNHCTEVLIMAYAAFAPQAVDFVDSDLIDAVGERAMLLWQREVAADFERLRISGIEYRDVALQNLDWVRDRLKHIGRAVLEEVRAQVELEDEDKE